jgi:hypothetical protein
LKKKYQKEKKNNSGRCVRPRPTDFKSLAPNCCGFDVENLSSKLVLCRCNISPEIMHKGTPEILASSKAKV